MELNNRDLYKRHEQLIELKRDTYEKIFRRCKNTIKLTSDAGELICFFKIPQFVFGSSYPIINTHYCANYIMNKLCQANKHIKTTFVEPDIIFIDWRRECDIEWQQTNKKLTKKIYKSTPSDNNSSSVYHSSSNSSLPSNFLSSTKKIHK
jgi:hypothetical protein